MCYKETIKSWPVAWIAILIAALMIACSDDQQVEQELPLGTPVTAHFRLATANSGITTRAEAENMKSWVVIITNQTDGAVESVITKENLDDKESDFVTRQVTTGTKRIYSFANITLEELIKAINPETGTIEDPIETIKSNNIAAAINAATFLPQGNNWADAESKGIPMSNWQDMEIKSDGKTYTLYVCRLIAKVEFLLKNLTNSDIKVKSVTISDITPNETPVKLLPGTSVTAEDTKQPKPTIETEAVPVEVAVSLGDAVTLSSNGTTSLTVYVNESLVQSDYGLFRLTLTIDRGTGEEEELRYALLSDDNSNWTWIARNDHRIIPINIDDYKLDLVPVDFPPIGVYPASVKEDEEGTFTCTFYAGGEFYLAPVVTRYSTGIPLTKDIFKAWNGTGADAQATGAADGEIHIGEDLGAGAMVYGTSTVNYLNYADLSVYSKMLIEGTPGVQLRVLLNRVENEGALTEVNVTIGADGTAEVSFAGMEFVHLNAIKTNWGSPAGTITKISLAKSDATWSVTSFTTPETTPVGKTNTTDIYDTSLSWNGKDPMLTGAFNNGATGEAYHELTVTVYKGNGVTQTLLGRVWVKLGNRAPMVVSEGEEVEVDEQE